MALICIYTGGALSLLLGVFHTRFFKRFKWEKEFKKISEVNRRIFYTIHMALLLLFFLFAFLSFVYAREMSESLGLALGLNIGLGLFWLWRFAWQVWYFKRLRRGIHWMDVMFLGWFLLLFFSYTIPVFLKHI